MRELVHRMVPRAGADAALKYAAARMLAECAEAARSDASLEPSRAAALAGRYRDGVHALLAECRQQGIAIQPEDFPGMESELASDAAVRKPE